MFIKNLCILVLWTKVASALEGLDYVVVSLIETGMIQLTNLIVHILFKLTSLYLKVTLAV